MVRRPDAIPGRVYTVRLTRVTVGYLCLHKVSFSQVRGIELGRHTFARGSLGEGGGDFGGRRSLPGMVYLAIELDFNYLTALCVKKWLSLGERGTRGETYGIIDV